MKGWVGLVGRPIADGLPTLVVTHQLQVECRTGKVRQPETDVLPLCHATNWLKTDSSENNERLIDTLTLMDCSLLASSSAWFTNRRTLRSNSSTSRSIWRCHCEAASTSRPPLRTDATSTPSPPDCRDDDNFSAAASSCLCSCNTSQSARQSVILPLVLVWVEFNAPPDTV